MRLISSSLILFALGLAPALGADLEKAGVYLLRSVDPSLVGSGIEVAVPEEIQESALNSTSSRFPGP